MSDRPLLAHCLEYPIQDFGGVEVLVRNLLEGLSEKFRIVLVSNDPGGALDKTPINSLIESHVPWVPSLAGTSQYRELARTLKSREVKLAHFHFGGTYGWGNRVLNRCPIIHLRRLGIPVVATSHGVFSKYDYCASYRPLWLKRCSFPYAWLAKMQQVAACEVEFAVSQNDLRNLSSWYWPVKRKFKQLYHSKLQDEPVPKFSGRQKTILCVGTIGTRKGQQILAQAFAQIASRYPEWRVVLAGRNGAPEIYSEILEIRDRNQLQDRIVLDSQLSDEEVADLMRNSAIFAMPSLHEGLGLSLQEALYRGMACVGSRVGGVPELITHNVNGLLVESGNVPQLSEALETLISNDLLRERLSSEARPSVLAKGMTSRQMVEKYSATYREMLAQFA